MILEILDVKSLGLDWNYNFIWNKGALNEEACKHNECQWTIVFKNLEMLISVIWKVTHLIGELKGPLESMKSDIFINSIEGF